MKFSRQNNVNHISATQVVTQVVVFDPDTFVNGCVFSTHLRLSTPVCAIDGSMKKVHKKYFVENQTSKASIKLIKTAEGCEKLSYELLQKCLILN